MTTEPMRTGFVASRTSDTSSIGERRWMPVTVVYELASSEASPNGRAVDDRNEEVDPAHACRGMASSILARSSAVRSISLAGRF